MDRKRGLVFFRNYFIDFFDAQNENVREKIDYVLFLVTTAERIPGKFFSHVEDTEALFEIRIEWESNIYRIFCCFDEGNLVVLLNGFQKKTGKTPMTEIQRALNIKNEYFNQKKQSDGCRK